MTCFSDNTSCLSVWCYNLVVVENIRNRIWNQGDFEMTDYNFLQPLALRHGGNLRNRTVFAPTTLSA